MAKEQSAMDFAIDTLVEHGATSEEIAEFSKKLLASNIAGAAAVTPYEPSPTIITPSLGNGGVGDTPNMNGNVIELVADSAAAR